MNRKLAAFAVSAVAVTGLGLGLGACGSSSPSADTVAQSVIGVQSQADGAATNSTVVDGTYHTNSADSATTDAVVTFANGTVGHLTVTDDNGNCTYTVDYVVSSP